MAAIVSGSEYLALPRAPETWLIEGLLPVGGSMLLFGDAKVGKSFAALQLATCLTSGVDWLGFPIPVATPVVYVQLDTPRTLWADRVQQLANHGYPVEAIHQADKETLGTFPFDILNPEHFALLATELKTLSFTSDEGHPCPVDPGVVIIDTLREAHSGDENDSTEMQKVIAHLEAAVKPAALILISHARKHNPEHGHSLMNDNRGSNYIVGRMDAICRFSQASVRFTSRAMEEQVIKLDRKSDGTWDLTKDPWLVTAEELYRNATPDETHRDLAKKLHALVPTKTEEAARSWFRRRSR